LLFFFRERRFWPLGSENSDSSLWIVNTLRNLALFWNLILVAAVFGTLSWFFYAVFLKKLLRARRIANVRERRLMREAAERSSNRR
jgi:hypothetical protein